MNPFEFSMMQAVSGMRTNSQRITVSAENVSNADTPGYQRKILTTEQQYAAGVSFGAAGTTHHCTEDLAIMRSFANMTIIAPADGIETANAVRACVDIDGPVYIRIGRGFEPPFHDNEDYGFEIGKFLRKRTKGVTWKYL